MKRQNPLSESIMRYQNTLQSAVDQFRKAEDHDALTMFMKSIEDLELILQMDREQKQPCIPVEALVSALRQLDSDLKNQDIVAIVDLIVDTLLPLAKEWMERDGVQ